MVCNILLGWLILGLIWIPFFGIACKYYSKEIDKNLPFLWEEKI